MISRYTLASVAIFCLVSTSHAGNVLIEEARIESPDPYFPPPSSGPDSFGVDVSLSDDLLAVGMPGEDFVVANGSQGAVHVFRRTGHAWNPESKLILPGNLNNRFFAEFGGRVAAFGDRVVATTSEILTSQAYVFEKSGDFWQLRSVLDPLAGSPTPYALNDVDIWGDRIIIGTGFNAGSAFAYQRSAAGSWLFDGELRGTNLGTGDAMGTRVAVHMDTAVVSAHGQNGAAVDSGAAYVFRRGSSGWIEEFKLVPNDAGLEDFFGLGVDVFNDVVVVGAPLDDDLGVNSGSAYVFERVGSNWTQTAKIHASDGVAGRRFGNHVSIYGDYIAVGGIGTFHLFHRTQNQWIEVDQGLMSSYAVDLNAQRLAIGFPEDVSVYLIPEPSSSVALLLAVPLLAAAIARSGRAR